jgi:hypothetical protein
LRGDVKLFHSGYDMVEQITPQEVRHARARTLVNPVELSCRLFKLTRLCVEVFGVAKIHRKRQNQPQKGCYTVNGG